MYMYVCVYIYIYIYIYIIWARLKNPSLKCITLSLIVAECTTSDGWPRLWRHLLRHLCDKCRGKPLRHLL